MCTGVLPSPFCILSSLHKSVAGKESRIHSLSPYDSLLLHCVQLYYYNYTVYQVISKIQLLAQSLACSSLSLYDPFLLSYVQLYYHIHSGY